MRIALFHNLPPGGARRTAYELVRHTSITHSYDFYRVDLGAADRFPDDLLQTAQDIATLAADTFTYPLPARSRVTAAAPAQVRQTLEARADMRVQRAVAADIDRRGYDLVLAHHDVLTQAPSLLLHLQTPSLYYVNEPRRQSFEYAMSLRRREAAGMAARGVRLAASAVDARLREADIRATRAATVLASNSFHTMEFVYRAYGRYASVCHLGIDERIFVPAPGGTRREGVVAVGALDANKGHDLLIRAVSLVPAEVRPPVTIVFERERPGIRDELRALAATAGVKVEFRRSITDAELSGIYASSCATVGAARVEPFGLTAVESLACGTPVVAVNEGGYREVLRDGITGLLAPRRPDRLAEAITAVVTAPDRWDPQALRASVLPYFSWPAAGERLDAIMQETAGRR